MSLIKLPLRMATVKALSGRTYAGSLVFDSAITPLETQVDEKNGAALITVYSDDAHANSEGFNVRDLIGFRPRVSLTLHLAIAKGLTTASANKNIVVQPSDAGLELILDILEAQIFRVLQTDVNPWSDLFRMLALKIDDLHIRRGASSRKGVRFAAREIVIPVEGFPDPVGNGSEYPWNVAIEAFKCDTDTDDVAAVLEDFCTANQMTRDWRKDLAATGFDRGTARALGMITDQGEDLLWL